MKKLIILWIISFKLVASDTISLSFATLSGTSNYEVWQDSTALRSKLIFPFKATLLHVGYDKNLSTKVGLSFDYATKIMSKDRKGEDYDWQHKNLTVYSFSKNRLNNYQSFLLASSYKYNVLTYLFSLSYRHIKVSWSDTLQIDYVKDEQILLYDKTVSYQQDELFLGFSPSYSYQNKKIKVLLTPSLYYGINFTKDKHINRAFDAKATYKGLAYGAEVKVDYALLASTTLTIAYKSFYFEDDAKLEYESETGFHFRTLPSSFSHTEHSVGIGVKFRLN